MLFPKVGPFQHDKHLILCVETYVFTTAAAALQNGMHNTDQNLQVLHRFLDLALGYSPCGNYPVGYIGLVNFLIV